MLRCLKIWWKRLCPVTNLTVTTLNRAICIFITSSNTSIERKINCLWRTYYIFLFILHRYFLVQIIVFAMFFCIFELFLRQFHNTFTWNTNKVQFTKFISYIILLFYSQWNSTISAALAPRRSKFKWWGICNRVLKVRW